MRYVTFIFLLALLLCTSGASDIRADELPGRGQWVPSWTITYGGYRQAEDLVVTSESEAWGVDATQASAPGGGRREQTAMVHFADGVWRTAQLVDGVGLEALDVSGDELGFAVGSSGALYQLRDGKWRSLWSPTGNRLRDVSIGGARSAWAVGDLATLLHWNGREWVSIVSPVPGVSFRSVAATGPDEAWATAVSGEILHWQAGTWGHLEGVRVPEPHGMDFQSPERGLIVGKGVSEWRGSAWQQIDSPYYRCESVAWAGEIAYLTCDNKLVVYDNGAFRDVDLSSASVPLSDKVFQRVVSAPGGAYGLAADGTTVFVASERAAYIRPEISKLLTLDMIDTGFGWAGGASVTAGFVGAVDGTWSRTQALPQGVTVGALALSAHDDGWAVGREAGDAFQARMWRWDGTKWGDWTIDKTWEITDIELLPPNEGWAGRGNVLVRWTGDEWRTVPGAPEKASHGGLSVLRGGEDPEGWFGSHGELFHLAGREWLWEPLSDYSESKLLVNDVEVPHPEEGWAITHEALYRYDGDKWDKEPLPTQPRSVFVDVDAPERGNAWVLVEPDGLFHWSGFAWEYHTLVPMGDAFKPLRIEALRLDPESLSTDVWLVGESPSIGLYRVVTPVGTVHLPSVSNAARLLH